MPPLMFVSKVNLLDFTGHKTQLRVHQCRMPERLERQSWLSIFANSNVINDDSGNVDNGAANVACDESTDHTIDRAADSYGKGWSPEDGEWSE